MSLHGGSNAPVTTKFLGYNAQTSIYNRPIPLVYGTARISGNVIWSGDWQANPVNSGGKFGSGKGGSGGKSGSGQQYDYKSALIVGLCHGPVTGLGYLWIDQVRLTVNSSKETTVLSSTTYTPINAANFASDLGVGSIQAYSVTANDYGSPGPRTVAGVQRAAFQRIIGTPTSRGQYSVDLTTGVYSFNAGDLGITIELDYIWFDPNASTDGNPVGSQGTALFTGNQGQSPWAYLTSNHPDQALGYSTMAYTANPLLDLGSTGVLSNYNWEVMGQFLFGNGIVDANIGVIIPDFLSNPLYGALYPYNHIGSLAQLTAFTSASGIFVSSVVDEQRDASEQLQDWLTIANCAAVYSEGLLKFPCYGDKTLVGNGVQFTPNTTPIYDLDEDDFICKEGEEPIKIDRPDIADAYNSVSVEWTNRGNDYKTEPLEEKDDWAVGLYGLRPAPPVQLHDICSQSVAQLVANQILQRTLYVSSGGNTYRFTISAITYALLEPMDMITISLEELNITKLPVRITSIQENDNLEIEIECEDFPWGTATATLNPKQTVGPFGPEYYADPGVVATPHFVDLPLEVTQGSEYAVGIGVTGGQNYGGCDVYVSTDSGASYSKIGRFTATPTQGVLTAALPGAADPDNTNTLSLDISQSLGILDNYTALQRDTFVSLFAVDDELMSYENAALTGPYAYNLTSLRRGVYGSDSTAHAIGAPFTVLDGNIIQWDYDASVIGTIVYFKFTPFNLSGQREASIANVTAYPFFVEGPRLPYPTLNGGGSNPGASPTYGYWEGNPMEVTLSQNGSAAIATVSVQTPVNAFSLVTQPPATAITVNNTGGSIVYNPYNNGVWFVGVFVANDQTGSSIGHGLNLLGRQTPMTITKIVIPSGINTASLTIAVTPFLNTDSINIVMTPDPDWGWVPCTFTSSGGVYTVTATLDNTPTTAPDQNFDHFLFRSSNVVLSSIFQGTVTAVSASAPNVTLTFAGVAWSTNQWAGRIVSCVAMPTATQLYFNDCPIISNTATTITLLGAAGSSAFAVGCVVAIRLIVTAAATYSLTDGSLNLTPNSLTGQLLWIFQGAGTGQVYPISANDATTISIGVPWAIMPAAGTVFMVVDPNWITLLQTPALTNSGTANFSQYSLPINALYAGNHVLQAVCVDSFGNLSLMGHSKIREMYQAAILPTASGNATRNV